VPDSARRLSPEVAVAAVVFVVALAGLAVLRDRTAPHYPPVDASRDRVGAA